MRTVKYLVVHCTATAPTATPAAIQNYWKNTLGWKNPGYHILIDASGIAHKLLEDAEVGNGVQGYNQYSLHVSYIGGLSDKDTRTDAQKDAILKVLKNWKKLYPSAEILGHRDFPKVQKACPCFDAKKEYLNV